jgi:hypothetical protein
VTPAYKLSGGACRTLALLGSLAGDQPSIQVGVPALARLLDASERSVKRWTQELRDRGRVWAEWENVPCGDGWHRSVTTYWLFANVPGRSERMGPPVAPELSPSLSSSYGKPIKHSGDTVGLMRLEQGEQMAKEFRGSDPKPKKPVSERLVRGVDGQVHHPRAKNAAGERVVPDASTAPSARPEPGRQYKSRADRMQEKHEAIDRIFGGKP